MSTFGESRVRHHLPGTEPVPEKFAEVIGGHFKRCLHALYESNKESYHEPTARLDEEVAAIFRSFRDSASKAAECFRSRDAATAKLRSDLNAILDPGSVYDPGLRKEFFVTSSRWNVGLSEIDPDDKYLIDRFEYILAKEAEREIDALVAEEEESTPLHVVLGCTPEAYLVQTKSEARAAALAEQLADARAEVTGKDVERPGELFLPGLSFEERGSGKVKLYNIERAMQVNPGRFFYIVNSKTGSITGLCEVQGKTVQASTHRWWSRLVFVRITRPEQARENDIVDNLEFEVFETKQRLVQKKLPGSGEFDDPVHDLDTITAKDLLAMNVRHETYVPVHTGGFSRVLRPHMVNLELMKDAGETLRTRETMR
jgi:hypothetical protein